MVHGMGIENREQNGCLLMQKVPYLKSLGKCLLPIRKHLIMLSLYRAGIAAQLKTLLIRFL